MITLNVNGKPIEVAVAPDTPHLQRDPVIAYLPDDFQRPYPLQPVVVVDVGGATVTPARYYRVRVLAP